jgi:hypothetical protein
MGTEMKILLFVGGVTGFVAAELAVFLLKRIASTATAGGGPS